MKRGQDQYIRVSSEKQAQDDKDLRRQQERIRETCERRGMNLLGIDDDIWSGADPRGVLRREGLKAAVKRARSEKAVLVIPEPTRLFRNVEVAREWLKTIDFPIFSVREERVLSHSDILSAIARGEEAVRNIRRGTKEGLARKKEEGVVFNDQSKRAKAAKASAEARKDKAAATVFEIVRIFQSRPEARSLKHRELADLLNKQGILTGWRRAWTASGVRGPRKKAEELLNEWEEIENDDTVGIPVDNFGQEIPFESRAIAREEDSVPQNDGEERSSPDDPSSSPEDYDEEAELRKLPMYGMF